LVLEAVDEPGAVPVVEAELGDREVVGEFEQFAFDVEIVDAPVRVVARFEHAEMIEDDIWNRYPIVWGFAVRDRDREVRVYP
jgi:hypothetical protein